MEGMEKFEGLSVMTEPVTDEGAAMSPEMIGSCPRCYPPWKQGKAMGDNLRPDCPVCGGWDSVDTREKANKSFYSQKGRPLFPVPGGNLESGMVKARLLAATS